MWVETSCGLLVNLDTGNVVSVNSARSASGKKYMTVEMRLPEGKRVVMGEFEEGEAYKEFRALKSKLKAVSYR